MCGSVNRLAPEQRLKGLSVAQRLAGVPLEVIENYLKRRKPEEKEAAKQPSTPS
jgi:hypothetical protein